MSARLRSSTTELEEMGEEATLTTSKLRALVQGLTGVDIQKDENTFKSIYDILLEIGKEWKNLTDVEQASLSEALFGKRNSQVGFAILNNVERLEELYTLAEDSAGSAMEEQEKYLQGAQYQIDRFKASVEELANDFMSSDFLKNAIKLGTSLVNILDDIIKNLGTIPTLFSAIGAAISTKHNLFFDLFEGSLFGSEKRLPLTANTDLSTLAASRSSRAIKTLIQEYNALGTAASKTGLSIDEFNAKIAEGDEFTGLWFSKLKTDEKALFKNWQKDLIATTVRTTALKVASMALNAVLSLGIGLLISGAISLIDNLIHHTEKLIEKGEEAKEKIAEINSTIKSQQDTIDKTAKRYAELAQGVDQLSGKNVSLSNDDYQEFLNISNELAEVFPSLTKGYDKNGNAILDLNGNVNTITKSLEDLLEAEVKLNNQKILTELPAVYEGIRGSNKQLKDDFLISVDDVKQAERYIEMLDSIGAHNVQSKYPLGGAFSSEIEGIYFSDYSFLNADSISQLSEQYGEEAKDLVRQLYSLNNQLESNYRSIDAALSTWVYEEFDYLKLEDEQLQSAVQQMINNIDYNSLDKSNMDELQTWIRDNILSVISNDEELQASIKATLDVTTEFNNGETDYDTFVSQMNSLMDLIDTLEFATDEDKEEFVKSIRVLFNFESTETIANNFRKQLKNSGITDEETIEDILGKLDLDTLKILEDSNVDWSDLLEIDDLDKQVEYVKNKAIEMGRIPFAINFNKSELEATTKGVKELQSTYQTLYQAMEEGKEGADLAFLMSDIDELQTKLVDADGQLVDLGDTWDDFFTIMTDGTHTFSEMEEALNKVLTAYVNATVDLSNYDKAQAEAISTQLQLAGVTKESAEAYVQAQTEVALALKNAEKASIDFENQLNDEIIAFINEADMSELARQQLALYVLEKQIANGLVIQTSADCDNLIQLASVAGATADQLARLISLKAKLANVESSIDYAKEHGGSYSALESEANKIKDEIEDILVEDVYAEAQARAANFKFNDKKASKSSGGGGSSKESDPWKEAYEKELAALNHLHEMEKISDIQYYEEREKLNEKYFGNTVEGYKEAVEEMKKIQKEGNVDLFNRPLVSGQKMIDAGWTDVEPDSIATVYSSAFDILDAQGKKAIVHVTPILPDGTVLSPDQLEDYVYSSLDGTNNALEADKLGIVLKVDTDVDTDAYGEVTEAAWKAADQWDITLHELQEKVLLSNKQNEKYAEEYNKNLEEIYKGFQSAYKTYIDDMSDYWKKSLDANLISFSEYCSRMKGMLDGLHDSGKIDDATYYENLAEYYSTVKENLDKVISAVQRRIKKEIDSLNKQKDAIKKNYEARIQSIQDEIDALNKANEARQKELDLQKQLYELNRAQNQRTDFRYESDKGFVYAANDKNIKEAQEQVEQTKFEQHISSLEESIETLKEEMNTLTDNIDAQIDKLQEYSDQWGEVANKFKESQEDIIAEAILGSDWQNEILSCNEETLRTFTDNYINLEQQQVDAAVAASNAKIQAYNAQIQALNDLKEAQENANKTALSSASATGTTLSNGTDNSARRTSSVANALAKSTQAVSNATKKIKINVAKGPGNRISGVTYGVGTDRALPGYHEIAETGDEIILDNYGNAYLAEGKQLHRFEGGEKVFTPDETKELLKGKYVPIDSILPNYTDMLTKVMSNPISTSVNTSSPILNTKKDVQPVTVDNSTNVTIGDIHVSEVNNVTSFAKAIKNELPNALLQELKRK